MKVTPDDQLHLTYCTNIHPGDGWAAVFANLSTFAPALKARFAPDTPFGIGLRLSARDARELLEGTRLEEFRAFLDAQGLYVAIINGFPYGSFHRAVVKSEVYRPDWQTDARVEYTLDLIRILGHLVPDGMDAGVSTAPLSYKTWLAADAADAWQVITANVVRVVEACVRLRRERGIVLHLDIEPEPDCSLENTPETLAFFEQWLLPVGGPLLATRLGLSPDESREALLDHVRICFDCCHFAVEYEDPLAALAALQASGIRIGRVQLSSAIRVAVPADAAGREAVMERLRPFTDPVYLHQVIERTPSHGLTHFADLPEAIDTAPGGQAREWRIHFHVPLFTSEYSGLGSTQDYVRTVLRAARDQRFTRHLEIETYTWDVLPGTLKLDLLESIAREYAWVLSALD